MPVDHSHNIVEVHDLSFSYNGNQVLKDVSINIHEGDYLGVIGPNGGGKTTLVKLILGLMKPSSGSILLFGQSLEKFNQWEKIGYVSQRVVNFDQKFPVTVRDVVQMGNAKDVDWALEQVQMTKFSERLIGDLSGGQQQRVFIARALAQKPEIIFLDEPTSGVDSQSQDHFYKLLDHLNHTLDITLVLVSHDVDILLGEVTEIACVNQSLIYHGVPKGFKKATLVPHRH